MKLMPRLASALIAAGLCLAGPTSAQETLLRAAVFVPPNTTFGEMFGRFVAHVNAEGKGLVQINLVGGPSAIPSLEQGNAVRTGVLDIAAVPPSFYAGNMPEADATILSPLTFRQQRASGAWEALNRISNQKMNSWYLAAYGEGIPFHIWTTKQPTSANFQGWKLRTVPNYTAFFQALGAAPITMPPGEVKTALERGVVDGYGWPLVGIFDLGWGGDTKYRIDPGFYSVVVNVLVNQTKWKNLRDDQRAFLTRMGEWLETENTRWAADKSASELKRQADAGIKVVNLGPDYLKLAYSAYWTELAKRAPESVNLLRPLLERKP
jgi:TRAP-type C4-dicarboxylate transport system substrate-binding protein